MPNEILYNKLIEVARQGKTISYGEVMSLVGLKPGNYGASEIGRLLWEISIAEHKNGRPLLSAIVVTNKMPGSGLFWLAKELKLQRKQTDEDFFREELIKVHKFWQSIGGSNDNCQYWLENYWPTESERQFLGVWFHTKKQFRPDDMRSGDRVIFYETRQNPDGYKGGSKTIFASGILTNEFKPIPAGREHRGGKEWQTIRVVSPLIWLPTKDGVPLKRLLERFPQFRGWLRKGVKLSKGDFEVLESMLKEKQREDIIKEELAYKEGAESRVFQTARERNPKLRQAAILKYGRRCMVCGISFDEFYGQDISNGYIEVHHEKALSESPGEREIRLDDVKVVCSNCHRMIHRPREMMDWKELRARIKPKV